MTRYPVTVQMLVGLTLEVEAPNADEAECIVADLMRDLTDAHRLPVALTPQGTLRADEGYTFRLYRDGLDPDTAEVRGEE